MENLIKKYTQQVYSLNLSASRLQAKIIEINHSRKYDKTLSRAQKNHLTREFNHYYEKLEILNGQIKIIEEVLSDLKAL